ncbi:MAG TPA: hypothetical protein VNN08_14540 [Thermoanaerobaculia bacterium]|nr:hypothetical protein [Thermoanaerobaculia bacterium]
MQYERFVIQNYRAISGPLTIDVSRNRLVPIIGVNESGKTTILHAIFAFDSYNDTLNDRGRHLKDTANLYQTASSSSLITAVLRVSSDELLEALDDISSHGHDASIAARLRRKRKHFPELLTITRNLTTRKYVISTTPFEGADDFTDLLARYILSSAPYILFFDDFRDSVDEKIEIGDPQRQPAGWLAIMERLFTRTDKNLSVYQLPALEERQRKSVLAKVKKHLNATLTREWQNFRLDDSDALEISIEYEVETSAVAVAVQPVATGEATPAASAPPVQSRHYLKLDVVEKDASGDEHYFFIRDRSKGFFWFFNFVMKLEFNPKVVFDSDSTIYLLDEPGSYLHASAQTKLCAKLRYLARQNCVIYCTHSHYLLDPELIPLSSIKVADKDANGDIKLIPIHQHEGNIVERRSAFQPVIDALQIKSFLLDLTAYRVIITEGVYDYYSIELFKRGRNITALPSVGASSVKYYISLMMAWRVSFVALWDCDDEGQRAQADAINAFGDELGRNHLFLIPSRGRKRRIMQDLFDGADLRMFRERLELSKNASFEKVIATLFFHPTRTEILNDVSTATREAFDELFETLALE